MTLMTLVVLLAATTAFAGLCQWEPWYPWIVIQTDPCLEGRIRLGGMLCSWLAEHETRDCVCEWGNWSAWTIFQINPCEERRYMYKLPCTDDQYQSRPCLYECIDNGDCGSQEVCVAGYCVCIDDLYPINDVCYAGELHDPCDPAVDPDQCDEDPNSHCSEQDRKCVCDGGFVEVNGVCEDATTCRRACRNQDRKSKCDISAGGCVCRRRYHLENGKCV